MVNDLNVSDDTVKFVDETTIWEIVLKGRKNPARSNRLKLQNLLNGLLRLT
ncbi:Hypothetical predicted protein [Paramuricea clavata]|uniref:Uncharacterized protein n=1 Tax=Paramuricea clavata TaxID=317549 RepID=A0A7D9HF95_PARCT|nr:Hypothetical predicted protein [Paramuricea clavata]